MNPAGIAAFGWRPEAWLGKSMLEMVHPDDVASVISSTGTMQSKRVGTPVEIRVRMADGGWKWVEIIATNALDIPEIQGLVVVARDVTRRRMWEVAANDTVRFQQVVQHASSITLLLDRTVSVTSANAAFTRLLGHDLSLVVGHRLTTFCDPTAGTELAAAIEKATRLDPSGQL